MLYCEQLDENIFYGSVSSVGRAMVLLTIGRGFKSLIEQPFFLCSNSSVG